MTSVELTPLQAAQHAREWLSTLKTGDSQADAYIMMAVRRLQMVIEREERQAREAVQAARPSRPGRH